MNYASRYQVYRSHSSIELRFNTRSSQGQQKPKKSRSSLAPRFRSKVSFLFPWFSFKVLSDVAQVDPRNVRHKGLRHRKDCCCDWQARKLWQVRGPLGIPLMCWSAVLQGLQVCGSLSTSRHFVRDGEDATKIIPESAWQLRVFEAGPLGSKLTLHTLQQGAGQVRDVCPYFFQWTSDQCDQEAEKTLCSTIPGHWLCQIALYPLIEDDIRSDELSCMILEYISIKCFSSLTLLIWIPLNLLLHGQADK